MRCGLCTVCGQLPSDFIPGWSGGMWLACVHWLNTDGVIDAGQSCSVLSLSLHVTRDMFAQRHGRHQCLWSAAPCKSMQWAISSVYRSRELDAAMIARICESWRLAEINCDTLMTHHTTENGKNFCEKVRLTKDQLGMNKIDNPCSMLWITWQVPPAPF